MFRKVLAKTGYPIFVGAFLVAALLLASSSGARAAFHRNPFVRPLLEQRAEVKRKAKTTTLDHLRPPLNALARHIRTREPLPPGQFRAYIPYYQRVVEYFPSMAEAHTILGFCYAASGDPEKAVNAYQGSIQVNPEFFWSYYNLGLILFRAGRYDAAASLLENAVTKNPAVTMRVLYGSPAYRQIMASDTQFDYAVDKALRSGYREAYELLVLSYERMGQHPQMLQTAVRAAQAGLDNDGRFSYYAGKAAYLVQDHPGAVTFLRESIRKDENNADAYRVLGLSFQATGSEDLAGQAFRQESVRRLRAEGELHQGEGIVPRIF